MLILLISLVRNMGTRTMRQLKHKRLKMETMFVICLLILGNVGYVDLICCFQTLFVPCKPKLIKCQEDDDFLAAFDRMMSESIQVTTVLLITQTLEH